MGGVRRLLCAVALLAGVLASPVAIGAFDAMPALPAAGGLLAIAAYAVSRKGSRGAKRAALAVVSVVGAVTLFDLAARPLLLYASEVRPADRFIRPWPSLPKLKRYVADVRFEGTTYGDLASMSGRRDWRETRRIRFVTDANGFRNEPADAARRGAPIDLVVLGDSFGVAAGTSQEEILSSLLARDRRSGVYNLSISRQNPQQEYATLLLEAKRLNLRQGALVLWLIFSGNDLDEPYDPELYAPRPVQPGLATRLVDALGDFRSRSPVHRLFAPRGAHLVLERDFLDGRPMLFFAHYAEHRKRTAPEVERHPNFTSLAATFDAMKRLSAQRRLSVAVVQVPSKEEVYSWVLDRAPAWSTAPQESGFAAALRGLSAGNRFRFLDLGPTLVRASRRSYEESGALLWWRDDTHWNGIGQRVAAAAIREQLLHEAVNR